MTSRALRSSSDVNVELGNAAEASRTLWDLPSEADDELLPVRSSTPFKVNPPVTRDIELEKLSGPWQRPAQLRKVRFLPSFGH